MPRHNGLFDEETTVLMHLIAGMAVGCDPCVEHYLKEVERLEIDSDKVATAQAICMAVSAGRVNAQVGRVENRLGARVEVGNDQAKPDADGCCS